MGDMLIQLQSCFTIFNAFFKLGHILPSLVKNNFSEVYEVCLGCNVILLQYAPQIGFEKSRYFLNQTHERVKPI